MLCQIFNVCCYYVGVYMSLCCHLARLIPTMFTVTLCYFALWAGQKQVQFLESLGTQLPVIYLLLVSHHQFEDEQCDSGHYSMTCSFWSHIWCCVNNQPQFLMPIPDYQTAFAEVLAALTVDKCLQLQCENNEEDRKDTDQLLRSVSWIGFSWCRNVYALVKQVLNRANYSNTNMYMISEFWAEHFFLRSVHWFFQYSGAFGHISLNPRSAVLWKIPSSIAVIEWLAYWLWVDKWWQLKQRLLNSLLRKGSHCVFQSLPWFQRLLVTLSEW